MSDLLVSTLFSVLAGIVTAWIAVGFALRRFYTERWWERKAATYSELMAALYRMAKTYESYVETMAQNRTVWRHTVPDDKSPEQIAHDEAADAVAREVAMGEFVISSEASSILTKMQADLVAAQREVDSSMELFNKRSIIVDNAMVDLRAAAKRDLRLD